MTDTKPVKIIPHKHPLNDTQRTTLNALCDLMIPASSDGKMPAASSLDLYADMTGLPDKTVTAFDEGLAALEQQSQQLHGKPFTELDSAVANAIVEQTRPESRAFFAAFTVQTAARYHTHDSVMPLIGLEARPPWPQGNPVDDGDWSLLDPVRTREPFYRKPAD